MSRSLQSYTVTSIGCVEEERLSRIQLKLEPATLKQLKYDDLKNQLAKYRLTDKNIPKVSALKTKSNRLQAVLEAVERYEVGERDFGTSDC